MNLELDELTDLEQEVLSWLMSRQGQKTIVIDLLAQFWDRAEEAIEAFNSLLKQEKVSHTHPEGES